MMNPQSTAAARCAAEVMEGSVVDTWSKSVCALQLAPAVTCISEKIPATDNPMPLLPTTCTMAVLPAASVVCKQQMRMSETGRSTLST